VDFGCLTDWFFATVTKKLSVSFVRFRAPLPGTVNKATAIIGLSYNRIKFFPCWITAVWLNF
jgi:hypothetical protein